MKIVEIKKCNHKNAFIHQEMQLVLATHLEIGPNPLKDIVSYQSI